MTELRTYIVLAAYPAVVMFVFDWCGPVSRWAFRSRSTPVPIGLRRIGERRGRFLLLIKYALVFLLVETLAGKQQWQLVSIATHPRPWPVVFASGILGGLLIFGFRRALALVWQPIAVSESNDSALRGSVRLWLFTFIVGGFVEEFWRALCISSFQQHAYGAIPADSLPAIAFSIAHMSGLPSRIPGGLEIAAAESATGLLFGAIFIWSGNLVSACLASIMFYSCDFYWLRRRYGCSASDGPRSG